MDDKLLYIPNDETQNYTFCRLKLVVEMFEHSTLLCREDLHIKMSKKYYKTYFMLSCPKEYKT